LDSEEERIKLFSDLKGELYKRQLSNAENFDKSILTYSSAGLGFSLAFLKDFLPITKAAWGWLLYLSWGLFTLAIIITILSYMTSQRGIKKQLSISERYYLNHDEKALKEKNRCTLLTDLLNSFSGMSFVVAIVATTLFVSINLERATTMAEQKKGSLREGAPIPSVQKIVKKGAPVPAIQPVTQQPATQKPGAQQPASTPVSPKGGNKE